MKHLLELNDLLEEAGYDLTSKDEVLIKRKEIIEFDTIQVSLGK